MYIVENQIVTDMHTRDKWAKSASTRSDPNTGGPFFQRRAATPFAHLPVAEFNDPSEREARRAEARAGAMPDTTTASPPHTSGEPLDPSTRAPYERLLDGDLAQMRVHHGNRASRVAEAYDARAVTVGRDVFFGRGQFSPGTRAGRGLLAHEATHVRQGTGVVRPQGKGVAKADRLPDGRHFATKYASVIVVPYRKIKPEDRRTYGVTIKVRVALIMAFESKEMRTSAMRDAIVDALRLHAGGWKEASSGQRMHVTWEIDWTDSTDSTVRDDSLFLVTSEGNDEALERAHGAGGLFQRHTTTTAATGQRSSETVILPGDLASRAISGRKNKRKNKRAFRNVAAHEFGHALGLGHQSGTVMNKSGSYKKLKMNGDQILQALSNLGVKL